MENIYELAGLIYKDRKTLESIIPEAASSPLKKLSSISFSKKHLTDEECMIKIYGNRNVKAFSSLKKRLTDSLISVLILQQGVLQDTDEVALQHIDNLRKILCANILLSKGPSLLGLKILEKSIAFAIKKNLAENVLTCARRLIAGYGSELHNTYKHNKYLRIQIKFLKIYEFELKAQNYYFELQEINVNPLNIPSQEFINKVKRYIADLESVGDSESPIFQYNKYRVEAIYYEYIKDYNSLLNISKQVLIVLSLPSFNMQLAVSNINIRIILAFIHLNKLKEAIEFSKEVIPKIKIGTNSWFRMHYYAAKSYFYIADYINAIKYIIILNDNKIVLKKYPNYTELIETIIGYVHLLIESKYLIIKQDIQDKIPYFKLGKYLNSVPIYSKDKSGINISILLLHTALLLLRKDYNTIIDRIDSLKQYAYRYLRRDDSFRSNCMIKMVIQMTKADFHPVRTERYTADLFKQLKSVNLAGSGENIEIEVIPFEVLWEIMLKSLKD